MHGSCVPSLPRNRAGQAACACVVAQFAASPLAMAAPGAASMSDRFSVNSQLQHLQVCALLPVACAS